MEQRAGVKANRPPKLTTNKVPVAKLVAVKDAMAISDIVLARHLGVTRQTLSAWRSAGEIPTMAALALEALLPAQPVALVCTLAASIEQLERLRTFLKKEKVTFRTFKL
jgi:DNA-binding transcriptional regulator YiaG